MHEHKHTCTQVYEYEAIYFYIFMHQHKAYSHSSIQTKQVGTHTNVQTTIARLRSFYFSWFILIRVLILGQLELLEIDNISDYGLHIGMCVVYIVSVVVSMYLTM